MLPVITFLTDFGLRDGYVAAMKGAVLQIAPEATLVDVSHAVPPQDVYAAAYILSTSSPYFPPNAIHIVVVDPGVGTSRRAILLETPSARFLAPDNGVLTYVLQAYGARAPGVNGSLPTVTEVPVPALLHAYQLVNPTYFRLEVSQTFHGRDIFAPVAAHLARGVPTEAFGPRLDSVLAFTLPHPETLAGGTLQGTVIHVDTYGNLITNVRREDIPPAGSTVRIGGREIRGLQTAYQREDELLAIIGSSGYLEIAAANGSAANVLGVQRWAAVDVHPG